MAVKIFDAMPMSASAYLETSLEASAALAVGITSSWDS